MNLEELLTNNMNGIGENDKSETPLIETLRKQISKDEVRKFCDLIREQSRKTMEWIEVAKTML